MQSSGTIPGSGGAYKDAYLPTYSGSPRLSTTCQTHIGLNLQEYESANKSHFTTNSYHNHCSNINSLSSKSQFPSPPEISPSSVSTTLNAVDATMRTNHLNLLKNRFQNCLGLLPSRPSMANSAQEASRDRQPYRTGRFNYSFNPDHSQSHGTVSSPYHCNPTYWRMPDEVPLLPHQSSSVERSTGPVHWTPSHPTDISASNSSEPNRMPAYSQDHTNYPRGDHDHYHRLNRGEDYSLNVSLNSITVAEKWATDARNSMGYIPNQTPPTAINASVPWPILTQRPAHCNHCPPGSCVSLGEYSVAPRVAEYQNTQYTQTRDYSRPSSTVDFTHSSLREPSVSQTKKQRVEPYITVRYRPGRHSSSKPPSHPKKRPSVVSSTVQPNPNLSLYQVTPSYGAPGNSDDSSLKSTDEQHTGGDVGNNHYVNEPFHNDDMDLVLPQSIPPSSDVHMDDTDQSLRHELYPTLESPFVTRLRDHLPYPLGTCFSKSRPSDEWQQVVENILDELSIDAKRLHQYDATELPGLLKSLCAQKLYSVERKGPKGGLTAIHCATSGCTKRFGSHNVARNFAHHLMKKHWRLNPFICNAADCGSTFAWPDDRTRHEKDQHGLVCETSS